MKKGDLIKCKYKWGEEYKEGIGYIYPCGEVLYVGISCKDGGVTNRQLNDVQNIKKVKITL